MIQKKKLASGPARVKKENEFIPLRKQLKSAKKINELTDFATIKNMPENCANKSAVLEFVSIRSPSKKQEEPV